MTKIKNSELLIARVVEEIQGMDYGDVEALEELLAYIPKKFLIGFLKEEEWGEYTKDPSKLYEIENTPVYQETDSPWSYNNVKPRSTNQYKRNKQK
jgi:hypothetical protein